MNSSGSAQPQVVAVPSGGSTVVPLRLPVVVSLGLLYLVWGSTYFAMHIALEGFRPLQLAGIRYVIAGLLMLGALRWRGEKLPTLKQWGASAVVGTLLLVMGNGCVVIAQQWVASSLAAVMVASMPLFAAVFTGFWERWPRPFEWAGIALGTVGVVLLNLEGNLRASPLGAALLLLAPFSWALGSVWGRRLPLPKGMMASASQMLCGGVIMFAGSLAMGDGLPAAMPGARPLFALAYLILFGSIVAFSAYIYLLRTVKPALATSYAYVNPLVAVLLGVGFGGEQLGSHGVLGMAAIVGSVAIVALMRDRAVAQAR